MAGRCLAVRSPLVIVILDNELLSSLSPPGIERLPKIVVKNKLDGSLERFSGSGAMAPTIYCCGMFIGACPCIALML